MFRSANLDDPIYQVSRMRRASEHLAVFGIVIVLAGCGRIDAGATYFPDAIPRDRAPQAPAPDPAPDVRALLHSSLDTVFVATSSPSNISFSPPKPFFAEWQ